jgi:hypothetical protein
LYDFISKTFDSNDGCMAVNSNSPFLINRFLLNVFAAKSLILINGFGSGFAYIESKQNNPF